MWLFAAALAVSSCAGLHYDRPDAERMVLAAVRLTPSAERRGVVAKVELIHANPSGWAFRAYAVPACAPGVEVCSSLLGHYAVGRRDLALIDEDTGDDGVLVDTPATRRVREDIMRAHCTASSAQPER